jgi:hypothetical protein
MALVPVFVPSLASLLMKAESESPHPLTREQVLAIRDAAMVMMLPREVAELRGYDDLDPEECWEEWQRLRVTRARPGDSTSLPEDPCALLGQPAPTLRLLPGNTGVEIHFDREGRVTTVFLTPGDVAAGLRPRGLALLGLQRVDATAVLGPPTRSAAGWDRFDRDDVALHLEYTDGSASRATLMWAPALPPHLR